MSGLDVPFHFPQAAFLILLLIPFIWGELALTRYRNQQQQLYASSDALLSRLLVPRSRGIRWMKVGGWALVWTLLCLALMDPFSKRYSPSLSSFAKPSIVLHEVIFLVDTSASMRVPDGREGQTRLQKAKEIMEQVLSQLKGQMVSLYAFTSTLTPVVPATLDYLFTRLAIKELQIDQGDVGGTRFAPVLATLKAQAFLTPSQKYYSVIMLTDGGDTQLETLKGDAREEERERILHALSDSPSYHVRLFTIGLGSQHLKRIPQVTFEGKPVFSQLEPEILQQLAEKERGKYYVANEWSSWDLAEELMTTIKENVISSLGMQSQRQVVPVKKEDLIVDLYYQIPLGFALLFYLLNVFLPDVRHEK